MKKKNKISMKKNLTEYRAVLFDVDGTLYSQRGLRRALACDLARYYIRRPGRIGELLLLIKYRSVREHWTEIIGAEGSMEQQQYRYVADCLHTSPQRVESVAAYWIHQHPLHLLPAYKDRRLAGLLAGLRCRSVVTAAYSDYPAREKLAALGVPADYSFCSTDRNINCMKPDPKAMASILHTLELDAREVLMIGDRYSRDGLAAKNAGMDYVILPKSMPARSHIYQSLLHL